MTPQFTRVDYTRAKCSHAQFYNQFVSEPLKTLVLEAFTVNELLAAYIQSKGTHLRSLHKDRWERIARRLPLQTKTQLRKTGIIETGRSPQRDSEINILKAAAKSVICQVQKLQAEKKKFAVICQDDPPEGEEEKGIYVLKDMDGKPFKTFPNLHTLKRWKNFRKYTLIPVIAEIEE